MPADTAGICDHLERLRDAEDTVINRRPHARVPLLLGPSSPPVVQTQTPPGVRAPQSFRKTLALRSSGTCQMLSQAVMKSYALGGTDSHTSA